MHQILDDVPDLDVFLALEPEELGARILLDLKSPRAQDLFDPYSWIEEFITSVRSRGTWMPYGNPHLSHGIKIRIARACEEAINWLEHQGLISRAYAPNGSGDRMRVSRRGESFEDERAFRQYVIARHFPRDILHPRIAQKVWMAFMRGEYDVAVFQAMKAVEVAVREASGLPDRAVGVKLMRAAFGVAPKTGPLTDTTAEEGEQVARMELFAGAIGSFKNPHSHRDVNLDDATEATEAIMLANHLLRIVDGRRIT